MTSKILNSALLVIVVLQLTIIYQNYARVPRPAPAIADAPKGTVIDIDGLPSRGTATTALLEISDYECPFCIRHSNEVAPVLYDKYIKTGFVRHLFVNNPLTQKHPNALPMAKAAFCAGEQGQYWPVHDRLFNVQPKDEVPAIGLAVTGLDSTAFMRCYDGAAEKRLKLDADIVKTLKARATPFFAVGRIDGTTMHVTKTITGAQPVDVFQKALNDELTRR